jgi:hypothetical protein
MTSMVTRPSERAIEHEKTAVAAERGADVGKCAEDIRAPSSGRAGPRKARVRKGYDA